MTRFNPISRLLLFAITAITIGLAGCHDNDLWQRVPSRQAQFINEYWPLSEIAAVAVSDDGAYTIAVKDGPQILFGADGSWVDIRGRGVALPEQLIYDQLPDPLYRYIEELEATDAVYTLSRDSATYTVGLLDTTLTYTISTGSITYP